MKKTKRSFGQWGSVLGKNSARLNVVYFYNGKLFGLRASEHRNICLNNFEMAIMTCKVCIHSV